MRYNWSSAAVGAGFLAVGVAMIVGSLCGGRFSDWRRARVARAAPDGNVDPEFRLEDQVWGVLVCAAGCVMYGWLVEISAHPAAVLFATFLSKCTSLKSLVWPLFLTCLAAGFGMNWVFVTTTAFLTECVAQQTAGAFALGNLLRNPGAAIAAVIVPSLVARMGAGWCFTGLALLDLVLVGSAVIRTYAPERSVWKKPPLTVIFIVLRIKCPRWRAARSSRMKVDSKPN